MKPNKRAIHVLFVLAAVVTVVGCELAVDFDRTKIPTEGVDAGTIGEGGFIVPSGDSSVTTQDSSVTDTGTANDAAAD